MSDAEPQRLTFLRFGLLWGAVALGMILGGCASRLPNQIYMAQGQRPLLQLHNDSPHDVICYVYVSQSGEHPRADRLRPAEVLEPGVTRGINVEPGGYDIGIYDCNRTPMMLREAVQITEAGLLLRFRSREHL